MSNKLLLDDRPLIVLPALAKTVGLNEAIVLQQLHWSLQRHNVLTDDDGVRWLQMSFEGWGEMFPFWSDSTIRRVFGELRDAGLVRTTRGRESNVYALNYDALAVKLTTSERSDRADAGGQVDQSPCKREGTAREDSEETLAAGAAADGDAPALPGLEPPPPPAQPATPADTRVEEIFAYYLMVFGDRLRVKTLTDPRSRTIKKALAAVDGDVELLKRAIDGLKSYRDTHPDGSNDISLSVIFATGPQDRSNLTEKIEWWAGHSEDKADIPSSVPSALRGRVLDLAVTVLKREQQPDSEAVAQRAIQAEEALATRFKLKVVSDGNGKLMRWEVVA